MITPLGDIWFERVRRDSFLSWFNKTAYLSSTRNEVKSTNNAGNLMYINMDNGFAWIEVKTDSDIGSTFEKGVMKAT